MADISYDTFVRHEEAITAAMLGEKPTKPEALVLDLRARDLRKGDTLLGSGFLVTADSWVDARGQCHVTGRYPKDREERTRGWNPRTTLRVRRERLQISAAALLAPASDPSLDAILAMQRRGIESIRTRLGWLTKQDAYADAEKADEILSALAVAPEARCTVCGAHPVAYFYAWRLALRSLGRPGATATTPKWSSSGSSRSASASSTAPSARSRRGASR